MSTKVVNFSIFHDKITIVQFNNVTICYWILEKIA